VPDPKQEIAVGGPLVERLKRRAILLIVRILRLPYRALTLPLKELRGEVGSLRAAAVESLAYVGVELRRLGDLVERSGSVTTAPAPEAAALAGVNTPGPVLVVGSRGRRAGASLTSLGYDVTQVDVLQDWDAGERHFAAVLYLGEAPRPDPAELRRIGDLISDDGTLVMGLTFGSNGSANGSDEDSLDGPLAGWAVAERIVVARRTDSTG
jgi:hypothetical protein